MLQLMEMITISMLFDLTGDVLTRMLKKAARSGLLTTPRKDEVISLQYADHIILFSNLDIQHLRNLKATLAWFE